MSYEIHDIWEVFKSDFKKKYNAPLMANPGTADVVRRIGKEYSDEKLRAMWNHYLSGCSHKGYAVSVENFLKVENLNKYASWVKYIGKKQDEEIIESIGYYCENWPCMGEASMGTVIEQPRCYENPCPLCGGWLLRMDEAEFQAVIKRKLKEIEDARNERAKDEAVSGVQHADGGGQGQQGEVVRTLSQIATSALQPIVDAPLEEFEDLDLDAEIDFF